MYINSCKHSVVSVYYACAGYVDKNYGVICSMEIYGKRSFYEMYNSLHCVNLTCILTLESICKYHISYLRVGVYVYYVTTC